MSHRLNCGSTETTSDLCRNALAGLYHAATLRQASHYRCAGSPGSRGKLRAHGVGPHEPPAFKDQPDVPTDPGTSDPQLPVPPTPTVPSAQPEYGPVA